MPSLISPVVDLAREIHGQEFVFGVGGVGLVRLFVGGADLAFQHGVAHGLLRLVPETLKGVVFLGGLFTRFRFGLLCGFLGGLFCGFFGGFFRLGLLGFYFVFDFFGLVFVEHDKISFHHTAKAVLDNIIAYFARICNTHRQKSGARRKENRKSEHAMRDDEVRIISVCVA